ncbi:MAG: hypothetical protein EOP83_30065 [Verrucomicrobiaceae bacterium]|nr:MAG: hypothetical protein EOP83_30065 [Verrucomicrobiaceae bacterium]
MLRFPLELRFRNFALTRQIVVTDASGSEVCFVKQKAFKLKESVALFRDSSQNVPLGSIEANRVIDWSARYTFTDANGRPFGAVGRRGMKSLFRAHYDIFSDSKSDNVSMSIQEESVAVRIFDSILSQIPILGMFSGYFLHPTYAIRKADGTLVARLRKRAAFLEGRFTLEKEGELSLPGLFYEAYEPMARKVLETHLRELGEIHGCDAVLFIHRTGWVPVGEASLHIRVLSSHRVEALRYLADSIDRLKLDVPIWKQVEPSA